MITLGIRSPRSRASGNPEREGWRDECGPFLVLTVVGEDLYQRAVASCLGLLPVRARCAASGWPAEAVTAPGGVGIASPGRHGRRTDV
jgi:hypothetical protein